MNDTSNNRDPVRRVPSRREEVPAPGGSAPNPSNAASGDAAYNATQPASVGRVPPRGGGASGRVGRLPPAGGAPVPPPRRLRRLHRVWRDRAGHISYLLTTCVQGRTPVLNNKATFERLVAFLLDSPTRYGWFGRRFVVMPDHIHLIARQGEDGIRLGQWIKALKAVVGGLEPAENHPVRGHPVGRVPPHGAPHRGGAPNAPNAASGDAAYNATQTTSVGRVPPRGAGEFIRSKRPWRWQKGYHDHKFRTPESESRKWEYVCLNPVRYGLVKRPEEWPFGGEIFYDKPGGPRLVRGTPPLLETGILIEDEGAPGRGGSSETPGKGTRPTT